MHIFLKYFKGFFKGNKIAFVLSVANLKFLYLDLFLEDLGSN